jgi:hypothetical protein
MQPNVKKQIHYYSARFEKIAVRYFVVVFVVLLGIALLSLRHNNQTMSELRQTVYTADEKNGDVEGALRNLREYVYGHMNTELGGGPTGVYPPLQLKHTYERLTEQVQATAKQTNAAVYTEAQAYCEGLYPDGFSGGPRVPCIRDYVAAHGVKVPTVPDSLYKFDFVSPRWSPDLAGWSLVLTVIAAIVLMARLAVPLIQHKFHV